MKGILLIDFGATRIKTAIVDIDSGIFSHLGSYPSFQNCTSIIGRFEIDVNIIRKTFNDICEHYYYMLGVKYQGICVCSQMHGFIVTDKEGVARSNYISWKDERSLEVFGGKESFSLATGLFGNLFRNITGMKPRPGLPFYNVLHMARIGDIEESSKIISIPEFIATCNKNNECYIHPTMCAGLGFYDISTKMISQDLVNVITDVSGISVEFNQKAEVDAVSGYLSIDSNKIPIYTGVGDHQCAVLGACNIPGTTISINLGTGSQVAIIDDRQEANGVELRPYFNESKLSTITHIPSGRVLSDFIEFITSIIHGFGVDGDVWKMIANYSAEQIINSTLNVDLGLFQSAWNYSGGGAITRISEGTLRLDNFLCSLVKCYVEQYLKAVTYIDPDKTIENYILSGGIPRNLPVIREVLEIMSGKSVAASLEIDETFAGLRTIALIAAKYSDNYQDAQSIYGRVCNAG